MSTKSSTQGYVDVGPAQMYRVIKSSVWASTLGESVELVDDSGDMIKIMSDDGVVQWNSMVDQNPALAGQFYDRMCFSSRSLNGK